MPLDLELPDRIAARLTAPLPGPLCQARHAPELAYGRHQGPPPRNARRAAVMILLIPAEHQWRIPFTIRPDYLPNHGGQISFPGGQLERGESIEAAALRELHEELGVESAGLRMLGRLSPIYVFGSNFLVTPCVAAAMAPPKILACPNEVAGVITPGLDELNDPQYRGSVTIETRGVRFLAPCIQFIDYCIWGATHMILAEFLEILGRQAESLQMSPRC